MFNSYHAMHRETLDGTTQTIAFSFAASSDDIARQIYNKWLEGHVERSYWGEYSLNRVL